MLTRNFEESLVPVCVELGVGIVAYSPLARNLLALPEKRSEDWRGSNVERYHNWLVRDGASVRKWWEKIGRISWHSW